MLLLSLELRKTKTEVYCGAYILTELHSAVLKFSMNKVSMNISEQSIISTKFSKCLYLFGVVTSIVSISGIKTNDRECSTIPLIHE